MKEAWNKRSLLSVLFATLLLAGCSETLRSGRAQRAATQPAAIEQNDRLLVLPFRDGSCLPPRKHRVTCHLTGEEFEAGKVPPGTGRKLARLFHQQLAARGVSLVPFDEGAALTAKRDPKEVNAYEPPLGVEVGKEAGATKAIMGVAIRYEERSGSWFGTRDPASVAFSLALIDVSRGTMIRKLRFNRRQAPLATNLLALPIWWQQGFRWWTRREVAERSLADAADALLGLENASARWTNMPAGATAPGLRQHRPQGQTQYWEP